MDEARNDFFPPLQPALHLPHRARLATAQRVPKEVRPDCTHAISSVWYELGEKIYKYFDSIELNWTSIDPVVRFVAEAGREESISAGTSSKLLLWVGVLPGTLSREEARLRGVSVRKEILVLEYDITDVEIAFCESVYTRYAGPDLGLKFLDYRREILRALC